MTQLAVSSVRISDVAVYSRTIQTLSAKSHMALRSRLSLLGYGSHPWSFYGPGSRCVWQLARTFHSSVLAASSSGYRHEAMVPVADHCRQRSDRSFHICRNTVHHWSLVQTRRDWQAGWLVFSMWSSRHYVRWVSKIMVLTCPFACSLYEE